MPVVLIQYEDGTERRVGVLEGDTLTCARTVSKHLYRMGRETVEQARAEGASAWGLDCKVCDGLLENGCKWLVLKVGGHRYRCALADMKRDGIVLHIKPHRAQYFLSEKRFEKVD